MPSQASSLVLCPLQTRLSALLQNSRQNLPKMTLRKIYSDFSFEPFLIVSEFCFSNRRLDSDTFNFETTAFISTNRELNRRFSQIQLTERLLEILSVNSIRSQTRLGIQSHDNLTPILDFFSVRFHFFPFIPEPFVSAP